jgi:hypothetical protein
MQQFIVTCYKIISNYRDIMECTVIDIVRKIIYSNVQYTITGTAKCCP